MRRAQRILSLPLLVLMTACGADGGDPGDDDDGSGGGGGDVDDRVACEADQAFDPATEACVDEQPAAGDVEVETYLFQQTSIGDTGAFGNPAKAEAELWAFEPMPADTRESFTTAEGERCTFEADTNYPSYYDGQFWPSGAGLDGGELTFTVAGGPGEIVLETSDLGAEFGTSYSHGEIPAPIVDGASSYPDFFDASYVPPGASFGIAFAGGADLPATEIAEAGVIPESPMLLSPDFENDAAAAVGDGLTVGWSTTDQRGTRIELALTLASTTGSYMMRCDLEDDGEVTLPAAELAAFTGTTAGIYISRQSSRTILGTTASGGRAFVHVKSRNDRLRQIELAP